MKKNNPEKNEFKRIKKAADAGDTNALCMLGMCYQNGIGTSKDEKKSFQCYKKAADKGNVGALYNLGMCYLMGTGTSKDEEKSFQCFKKAADKGNVGALYNLGMCYINGIGTSKNEKKAFQCYEKAADKGNAGAFGKLGLCYLMGTGTSKDEEKSFQFFKKAADEGYKPALSILGMFYEKGIGTIKNEEKAFQSYEKAVDKGDMNALNMLGLCYINGIGTSKNEEKAFECYEKTADAGDMHVLWILGTCYQDGIGTSKDEEKAFECYEKAADAGDMHALCDLGLCYQNGIGTSKNEEKAFECYEKAAHKGSEKASILIALLYYLNKVKDANLNQYKFYIKKAIQLGLNSNMIKEVQEEMKPLNNSEDKEKEITPFKEMTPFFGFLSSIVKFLDDRKVKKGNNKNLLLGHFSRFDTFGKIYNTNDNNKKIRLYHIKYSNDPLEGEVFYKFFKDDELNNDKPNHKFYPMYASFCGLLRINDFDSLQLWRAYGDDARGISLIFEANKFIKDTPYNAVCLPDDMYVSDDISDGILLNTGKMIDKKNQKIQPILYEVLYLPKNAVKKKNTKDEEKNTEKIDLVNNIVNSFKVLSNDDKEVFSSLFQEISHLIKYDDYEYENEYRLLYFGNKDDIQNDNLKIENDRIYAEYDLPKLHAVMRGPKTDIKEELAVEYILHKNDLGDIKNQKSEISYK